MRAEREAAVRQEFLTGGGEMGALIRSQDWSQTLLGSSETWPGSLKTALSILLNACNPMFLIWGGDCPRGTLLEADRILFYNDAYFSILKQSNHPVPLGQSVKDVWTQEWDSVRSDVEQVFTTGQPFRRENQRFPIPIDGNSGEHCYTWSYSAIWDETGEVGGVFATGCRVITEQTNALTSEEEYQQTRDRDEQTIQSLLRISEKLNSTLDVNALLNLLIEEAINLINAESGCSGLYTPQGMVCHHYFQKGESLPLEYCWHPGHGLPGWLIVHKVPYLTNNALSDSQIVHQLCVQFGVWSALSTPILNAQGEILGFFEIHNKKGGSGFTPFDQEKLVAVSQIAAIAIQNALSYQNLQHREETLQRREEQLRLITNAVPVLIAYLDQDHRYRFVNQTYEAWIGQRATEIIGKHVREVLGEPAYEAVRPYMEQALSGQRVSFESQISYRDGGTRYVRADYVPHINSQGEVEGYIDLVSDISDAYRQATQRKQVEAALRESEERARLAIKVGRLGTWRYDPSTDSIELDERMREIWGEPKNVVIIPLSRAMERIHPDDRPRVADAVGAALDPTSSGTYEIDYRILWDDGTERWVSANGQAQFEGEGAARHPVGFLGTAIDISDRKQAEESLRQSEERLRLAMEGAQMGTWDVDLTTGKAIWSQQHFTMLGYEPVDTGEATDQMWSSRIHPDDRERVIQAWQQSRQERRLYQAEYRVIRADNQQINWLAGLGSFTYDQSGQAVRSIGVLFDISDRKLAEIALRESEARFRKMADDSPMMIWMSAPDGSGIWFNRQWCEFTGQTLEEALGDGWLTAVHPEDAHAIAADCLQAHQRQESVRLEYRLRRQDGEYRWVFDSAIPRFDDKGVYFGYIGSIIDITDRKLAEIALRHSAERLSLALSAAKLGDWSWDAATDMVTFSQRAAEIFAIPPGPYMTWTQMQNLLHQEDRERARLQVEIAIAQSSDYDIEYRIIHPDETERWVAAKGRTQYNSSGHVLGMLGVVQDITDRKQAEQALQQAYDQLAQRTIQLEQVNQDLQITLETLQITEEELRQQNEELVIARKLAETEGYRYQELFDFAPHGYVVTDANGMIQEANQALAALIALEQSLLLDTPLTVYVHDSDVRAFRNLLYELYQNSQLQKLQTDELSLNPPKRNPIPVAITVTAIRNSQEQLVGARWLIQDISDRKQAKAALQQSEERYRYLVESIPQLVWTANAEGVLLDVNQRWLDFTGLTLAQAQIEGWQAIVHPDDVSTLSQNWASAQQNGNYYQAEGRIQRTDRVYRWHLHQAVPLKNERGQVIKWFGTATDIEDQKQLEQQRDRILQQEQAAREEAERANRIKDEFLTVLSHELRSPLNPILGWTKLLQGRKLDEYATQRALETIERNAKLQTQLIEDLLDVSRILRGKMVLNVTPVNLVTVIEAAIETVRLAAQAKQIEIQTVFASEVEQVFGDAARLQQIVWNLLSNAVKFTPAGGRVEVSLSLVNSHSSLEGSDALRTNDQGQMTKYAQIQVKDTGKGIKPEFLPHVFEYFRQEDGTTTRQFGGLGLGLAIVRHLSELHGGTVRADSPGEGLGATFTLYIPLVKIAQELPLDTNSNTDAITLSGVRILVVDDEPDMRDLIGFLLEQYGAQVNVVASAQEALTAFDQFNPDVLISDIGMPTMDGYMLMRQLRQRSPELGGEIPAIALTAYAGEFDQRQALAVGFQRHMAKPVEPEELVKAIATLILEAGERRQEAGGFILLWDSNPS